MTTLDLHAARARDHGDRTSRARDRRRLVDARRAGARGGDAARTVRHGDSAQRRSGRNGACHLRSGRQAREPSLLCNRQAHARAQRAARAAIGSTSSDRSATASIAPATRATSRSSPAASASLRCCCARKRCCARGARVRLFYGARTAELLVDAQRFADAGCELVVTTDDGTRGERGFVTDALARCAQARSNLCLRSVADVARASRASPREFGVRAQLSLEETFGCGVGGCWGCVVPLVRAERAGAELSAGASRAAATSSTRASARKARSFGPTSCDGDRAAEPGDEARKARARLSDADGQRLLRNGRGVCAVRRSHEDRRDRSQERHASCRVWGIRRRGSFIRRRACSTRSDCRIPASIGISSDEVHKYADRPCKIVGSVAGFSIDDYAYVCERLAARDEIAAVELNVSCPNVASEGETFGCDPDLTAQVVRAARATTDKTLIVKLSPNVTDIAPSRARRKPPAPTRWPSSTRFAAWRSTSRRGARASETSRGGLSGPGDSSDRRARGLRGRAGRQDSDRRSGRHRDPHRRTRVFLGRCDGDLDRNGELHRSAHSRAHRRGAASVSRAPQSRWRSTRSSERRTWDSQPRTNTKEMKVKERCRWPS